MSKRFVLTCAIVGFSWGLAYSQLILKHIDRSPDQSLRRSIPNARVASDPISLPFWDDFSASIDVPDTNLWEVGEHVFVNGTIGENPPSMNVATFDGAQRNGRPYQITEQKPGPTDSLISRAIDLSNIPIGQRRDIFISFYWQLKGFGEIPESIDSIRLQIMDADSVWHTIWAERGGIENLGSLFRYEEINLQIQERPERAFFHDNFRIKFQSFSTLRGIFDTWNIDYVYINRFRRPSQLGNPQSRTILDRAISKTSLPLFGNFFEIPIDHFNSAPIISQQIVTLSNIDRSDIHPVQYSHVITNTNNGQVVVEDLLIDGPLLNRGELDDYPGIDTTELVSLTGDSIVIQSEFSFRTGDTPGIQEINFSGDTIVFAQANIQGNDTLRQHFLLQDHYAYDDGTAEFSAGINLDQGQLAVQFFISELDTLTHIDIHFPALPGTAGQPMDIVIWRSLSEEGEIARLSHVVQEISARNEFTRIPLINELILQDTIYVGFQQFTDSYVGVGLDRSNPRATEKIFFNTSRLWERNTQIEGALMIRPIFGNADDLVLSSPSEPTAELILYPNPARETLNIQGLYDQLEIFDMGGTKRLQSSFTPELDVSMLPRGLYLVRLYIRDQVVTSKLIIEP